MILGSKFSEYFKNIYPISLYSFQGNYSFLNLEMVGNSVVAANFIFFCNKLNFCYKNYSTEETKDFRASGLGQVRPATATAAITLARLFIEMLCYVLGRLHSSCVLSTRICLHRIEVIKILK